MSDELDKTPPEELINKVDRLLVFNSELVYR